MKKQLVFYVSKIKNAEDKLFFRFIANNQPMPAVWVVWNDQSYEPKEIKKTAILLTEMLEGFNTFSYFRMQFEKDTCLLGSNPFFDAEEQKPYLDQHLMITEKEEDFWRRLLSDICMKRL